MTEEEFRGELFLSLEYFCLQLIFPSQTSDRSYNLIANMKNKINRVENIQFNYSSLL